MPRRVFVFDQPDRVVVDAIGPPGSRTFYLQARSGRAVISVSLEKTQVVALATRMDQLLSVIGSSSDPAAGDVDDAPLDEPLVEVFRAGPMALSWDAEAESIVLEAQPAEPGAEFAELPDEATEGPDLMRVRLSPAAARDVVRRAAGVVMAGRPTCPFCGQPLDPAGHFCASREAHLN
jgi:uncharacterized repeat protein (TIGR03847 family)